MKTMPLLISLFSFISLNAYAVDQDYLNQLKYKIAGINAGLHKAEYEGTNVRAKLATTAWRAGQAAQNGAKPQRRMASVTRRWRSA